ncbi:MAG: DUF2116 family Zn-ribbon domain-containing protein [Methanomassiliicoccales archaeon]|nr:DUF2116 family Zn-ribbon domain-containing protein [Methanomassiliicoccales archaeon]
MSLLPEHSHCLYCDDPIEPGEEYCSEECRRAAEGEANRERRRNMLLFGIAAAALVALTLLATMG